MTSALAIIKAFANMCLELLDFDPANSTVATYAGWRDMRDYENFACEVMTSRLTGTGPTVFQLWAADDASATNATLIKSHAMTDLPVHVGDYVVLECTAEELAQLNTDNPTYNLRYVSAKITCNNTADECVVGYVRFNPRFPADGLTADNIVATGSGSGTGTGS